MNRLTQMENKSLECCVILHGVMHTNWEKISITTEKIYKELSRVVEGETESERLTAAHTMTIKRCKCLGRYVKGKNCPISIEFQLKQDAKFILENKSSLNTWIYIDKRIQHRCGTEMQNVKTNFESSQR